MKIRLCGVNREFYQQILCSIFSLHEGCMNSAWLFVNILKRKKISHLYMINSKQHLKCRQFNWIVKTHIKNKNKNVNVPSLFKDQTQNHDR